MPDYFCMSLIDSGERSLLDPWVCVFLVWWSPGALSFQMLPVHENCCDQQILQTLYAYAVGGQGICLGECQPPLHYWERDLGRGWNLWQPSGGEWCHVWVSTCKPWCFLHRWKKIRAPGSTSGSPAKWKLTPLSVECTGSVSEWRGVSREMLRWEMGVAGRDKWMEEIVEGWMIF